VVTAALLSTMSGSAVASNKYDQAVLADSPWGYWNLASKTSPTADASGNGHTAFGITSAAIVPGPRGNAMTGSTLSFGDPVSPASTP